MVKLGVVGSRSINSYNFIKLRLAEIIVKNNFTDITIVSGGAKGVDSLAEQYAKEKGYLTEIYLPKTNEYE